MWCERPVSPQCPAGSLPYSRFIGVTCKVAHFSFLAARPRFGLDSRVGQYATIKALAIADDDAFECRDRISATAIGIPFGPPRASKPPVRAICAGDSYRTPTARPLKRRTICSRWRTGLHATKMASPNLRFRGKYESELLSLHRSPLCSATSAAWLRLRCGVQICCQARRLTKIRTIAGGRVRPSISDCPSDALLNRRERRVEWLRHLLWRRQNSRGSSPSPARTSRRSGYNRRSPPEVRAQCGGTGRSAIGSLAWL